MNNKTDMIGGLANLFIVAVPLVVFGGLWFLFGPVAVAAFVVLLFVVFATRYITRHQVMWRTREAMYMGGGLTWLKIRPDNRRKIGDQMEQANAIVHQVNSTLNSITQNNNGFFFLDRGHLTVVWEKKKGKGRHDVGKLVCYIGVPESLLEKGGMSSLKSMADALGGSIARVKGSPDFKVGGVQFARMHDVAMGGVTDGRKSAVYPVSERILDDDEFSGIVVMSVEMMRKGSVLGEDGIWKQYIAQSGSQEVGTAMEFNSTAANRNAAVFDSAYRTCIGVGSFNGRKESSALMLKNVMSSLNEAPVAWVPYDPASYHNVAVSIWSAVVGGVLAAMFIFGFLPLGYLIGFGAAVAVFGVSALFNSSWIARDSLVGEFRHGNIVPPPFMVTSPRRFFLKFLSYFTLSAGSNSVTKNRFALPSDRQMIPLHDLPVASFIAQPEVAADREMDSGVVPTVGVTSRHLAGMTDDDLFIGMAGKDQPFYFPLSQVNYPLFTAGGMGSGKTNFMQVLFTSASFQGMRLRAQKKMRLTTLWGETKGKGAYDTWDLVKNMRGAMFLNVNDPKATFRLALEGPRIGETYRGKVTTPAMVYANAADLLVAVKSKMGDSSIGPNSDAAMTAGFRAAMLLNSDELKLLELGGSVSVDKPNVIKLCNILLGNDSQREIGDMLGVIRNELQDKLDRGDLSDDSREFLLHDVLNTLMPYNDLKNKGRREAASAPKNKLEKLGNAVSYWEPSPSRKDTYIGEIVEHGAPVVLNTGGVKVPGPDGREEFMQPITDDVSMILLGATTYSVWRYIRSAGVNWEDSNIRIMQFYDEVSHIADDVESGEDIITAQVNEGRSFGDGMFMATQNLGRLPERIGKQVMSTPTRIWFKQDSTEELEIIEKDIGEESTFTKSNLKSLQRGQGVATVQMGPMEGKAGPFVLRTPAAKEWKAVLLEHKDMISAGEAWCEKYLEGTSSDLVFDD